MHYTALTDGVQEIGEGGGGTMGSDVPNESAPWVSNQTEEHQKTNEDIKQQQAKVPQPPEKTHLQTGISYTAVGGGVFWESYTTKDISHMAPSQTDRKQSFDSLGNTRLEEKLCVWIKGAFYSFSFVAMAR